MHDQLHRYCVKFLAIVLLSSSFAHAEQVDLSVPVCPGPFKVNGAKCEIDNDALAKLKTEDSCKLAGVKFDKTANTCKPDGAPPAPECRNVAAGTLVLKGDKCLFDSQVKSSASGDYVGDYFKIIAAPTDNPTELGGPPGTVVKVLSQKPLGEDDRLLKVGIVEGKPEYFVFKDFVLTGVIKDVKASSYIEYGAERVGWTYGVLAMPYKYYVGQKSFGTGVSIGPYVGRRWGRPGSAYTIALSAAIGSVKGEVHDADNKVTATPTLMAYSFAAGVMWDISKAQGVKPFKIGLFSGIDTVGADDGVKFKNNRKPWVAFQIGFDFTDN